MRDAGYDAWVQCARAVPIEREIERRASPFAAALTAAAHARGAAGTTASR